MNIKNYTSEIDPTVSMAKIEKVLIQVGVSSISKQYKDGICTGITFLLYDKDMGQTIPFFLQAQVMECFKIFSEEYSRPADRNKYKDKILSQANRTAWKILSDWVELQCSMIMLGQAKPLQMFLPFVYDISKEETLYDKVVNRSINLLPSSQ